MTTPRRWALLALLLIAYAACFGCNPALFPMFLQGESKDDPTLKALKLEDKKQEVKVAIVVTSQLDARQELHNVNLELTRKAVDQLKSLAKANEDKMVVIEAPKIQRYLASHPKWKEMDTDELAADLKSTLKVDFVIYVEINSMSLYEPGSQQALYHGRADLKVTLLNANNPEDTGNDKAIRSLYPNERSGPIPVDSDTDILGFRDKFLTELAKKVAYCFCAHPTINEMDQSRDHLSD